MLAYVMYVEYIGTVPAPLTVTSLREKIGPHLSGVVRDHRPVAVRRGQDELALIVGAQEALALVANRRFNPEVFGQPGSVSIWLPELELYSQGGDMQAAKDDLLSEVRVYVDEYLGSSEYVSAPNRSGHLPYVVRAYLADLRGELAEVIFPGPPVPPAARAAARAV